MRAITLLGMSNGNTVIIFNYQEPHFIIQDKPQTYVFTLDYSETESEGGCEVKRDYEDTTEIDVSLFDLCFNYATFEQSEAILEKEHYVSSPITNDDGILNEALYEDNPELRAEFLLKLYKLYKK